MYFCPMEMNALNAVSPIDGRYANKTLELADYFSEYALIKYRLRVEIEYLIALSNFELCSSLSFSAEQVLELRKLYADFSLIQAAEVKKIESVTNHDVKAIEYFLKDALEHLGLGDIKEFVHFALTSQDINNTAVPLSLKEAIEHVILPLCKEVFNEILKSSKEWMGIPMLAKTHGQAASPTKLGKEFLVFTSRIEKQIEHIESIEVEGKFGGATGNFNAHFVSYPDKDWVEFSNNFLKNLGLNRQAYTTQIEHYDGMAELMDTIKRLNVILLDLCKDVWSYISMGYFSQSLIKGEVGSSTMPHKVNPIDFENAEGNLGLANALLVHLSTKLPISRLQRDLTDSTVLRNLGMPFGHILIALKSIKKGWAKLKVNETAIMADLDNNWAVVAEAIQTVLRRENYPNPYEVLKALTRTNEHITKDHLYTFIDSLDIEDEIKVELKAISPYNYTGVY